MPLNLPKKAMVFAAGLGTRMRPLTDKIPKPLIKVGGKTLIDRTLDSLADARITNAVVNTHHLSQMLEVHLANRQGSPDILMSHEEELLETGGGIVKALLLLGKDPIFTINSDVIILNGSKSPYARLAEAWDEEKMDALMLLHPTDKAIGYEGQGDFELAKDGRLIKPESGKCTYTYTGLMIIKPLLFIGQPEKPFSLYRDFLHKQYIQPDHALSRVYGLVHDGKWLHVGTPDSIKLAEDNLSD